MIEILHLPQFLFGATFPTSPSLPAVTTATEVDPDFLNTFVDNINAMGDALIALIGGTSDGNLDIDAAKGIKWGTTLKIYFSGGDIIIDDGVVISGGLDVGGTFTIDTITDSGAGFITFQEDIVLAAGKYIDAPTGKFDVIDDSGASVISVLEDLQLAAGKYIDAPTGKFDVIDDSGAAQIIINEHLEMASGKGIQGAGASAISVNAGMNVTGNLDVSNTLTVNTIDDSGAVFITIQEDFEFAAGKYIDAPTGKFDVINDSGAAQIEFLEHIEMASGKGIQGAGASAISVNAGMNVTGNLDVTGTLSVDTINDSGGSDITFNEDILIIVGKTLRTNSITETSGTSISIDSDVRITVTHDLGAFVIQTDVLESHTSGTVEVREDLNIISPYTLTVGTPPNYSVSSELVDRTYDANTVAIAELADVVGTMINDLIAIGLFQ